MPGFTIIGGEAGGQGSNPASLNEVRRTHRWVFETLGQLQSSDICLVLKSASRPAFSFEEPTMHHNQEQVYYAGKHTWEPISLTWYDVEQPVDVSQAMWQWMASVIDMNAMTVEAPSSYKAAIATLSMLDGQGGTTESWQVYNGWPQALNWNALDYSSSDLQLIEAKYRYDRAVKSGGTGIGGLLSAAASALGI